jgi:hypothetical protein
MTSNWLVVLNKNGGNCSTVAYVIFQRRMEIAFERAGKFDRLRMEKDWRKYGFAEIIKHFGTSYQSPVLANLGTRLSYTPLGKLTINIARPEQFITIARKIN